MSISQQLQELNIKSPFSQDYIEPKQKSNYLRFKEGQCCFRILSKKEEVLSYFTEYVQTKIEGKDKTEKIINPDLGNGERPSPLAKPVWAMLVFDYTENRVKIWECTQKKFQIQLRAIASGKIKNDWTKYDIQVTRTGKEMHDTEYTVIFGDTQEMSENDKIVIKKDLKNIDILKLLTGDNPFLETN